MPSAGSSKTTVAIERTILRALCGSRLTSEDWYRFADRLTAYTWESPEHKVVYDALRAIKSNAAEARRDELPAQATRMGFPDVEWGEYFVVEQTDSAELDQLIGKFKDLNAH
jgi:hypothetical protein